MGRLTPPGRGWGPFLDAGCGHCAAVEVLLLLRRGGRVEPAVGVLDVVEDQRAVV